MLISLFRITKNNNFNIKFFHEKTLIIPLLAFTLFCGKEDVNIETVVYEKVIK